MYFIRLITLVFVMGVPSCHTNYSPRANARNNQSLMITHVLSIVLQCSYYHLLVVLTACLEKLALIFTAVDNVYLFIPILMPSSSRLSGNSLMWSLTIV